MNSNSLSKGAWLLIVLGLVVMAVLGVRTISNSDFWTHLAMGRQIAEHGLQKVDTLTFTVAGAPWVNSSWLYDRVLFLLWSLGAAPLVILLHAAAAVLAFVLLIPAARKWAGGTAISLALVLGAWLLASRFTIAPHVVALPLAAIFMMLFSEPRKAWVLWAVLLPVQVLWANIHSSFVLGPVICAVFAVQFWVSARSGERVASSQFTHALWLTVATLLAGLVNPYGLTLYASGIVSVTNGAFKFVQEWISPFSAQFPASFYPKHIVTLALFVGAGGLIAEKRNLPVGLATLAVASAFLIILFPRNVEWLALLAFPFFALSLNSVGLLIEGGLRSLTKKEKVSGARGAAAGLAAVLALLSVSAVFSSACYVYAGSASVFGLGTEYDLFPHAASKVIARPDFPARAVNLAPDGGFLVWEHPDRTIFVDQRASLYGVEFYRMLNKCLAGEEYAWKSILEKWGPEAVIMNCSVPFAANAVRGLLQDPSWVLVYFDGTAAILVRAVSENQALIRDVQIQNAGLQLIEKERQRAMKATGHQILPRLIGAGEMFLALGRYTEAESIYSALTRCAPMMGRAWINLGIAQVEQGKVQEAVGTLRHACDIAPKEVFAWISLYRACNRAGLADEARAAIERAKKVNLKTTMLILRSEQRAGQEPQNASKLPAQ
jgi:hypothetical protein